MNLLQLVQLAIQVYLKNAYPQGAPAEAIETANQANAFESDEELLSWSEFEVEDQRYHLRLGNHEYPHMKMVFLLEDNRPLFYVDAHDSHFQLSKNSPDYSKIIALRKVNGKLKQVIEIAWSAEKLPLFARNTNLRDLKKDCKGLTVLAIDDEIQILEMLGIIVKSLGAVFLRAQSAAEARHQIGASGLPDLIFCDIMMPDESGYDFVNWFREQGYQSIPIYFITGYALGQVYEDGFTEVLQKPFSAKSIMKIMKSLHGT